MNAANNLCTAPPTPPLVSERTCAASSCVTTSLNACSSVWKSHGLNTPLLQAPSSRTSFDQLRCLMSCRSQVLMPPPASSSPSVHPGLAAPRRCCPSAPGSSMPTDMFIDGRIGMCAVHQHREEVYSYGLCSDGLYSYGLYSYGSTAKKSAYAFLYPRKLCGLSPKCRGSVFLSAIVPSLNSCLAHKSRHMALVSKRCLFASVQHSDCRVLVCYNDFYGPVGAIIGWSQAIDEAVLHKPLTCVRHRQSTVHSIVNPLCATLLIHGVRAASLIRKPATVLFGVARARSAIHEVDEILCQVGPRAVAVTSYLCMGAVH